MDIYGSRDIGTGDCVINRIFSLAIIIYIQRLTLSRWGKEHLRVYVNIFIGSAYDWEVGYPIANEHTSLSEVRCNHNSPPSNFVRLVVIEKAGGTDLIGGEDAFGW